MITYICLLRGINVGGNNRLPMKELRSLLENMDLQNVQTYIQSGNVVFLSQEQDAAVLSAEISAAIKDSFGFQPQVLILTGEELAAAMTANPFPEAEAEPKSLHLYFMASAPKNPDLAALEALRQESERFQLRDRVFYLHAPDGIGRSKLAVKVEKALAEPATARNWRSVDKIMSLAQEISCRF
ncbi:MAG: DUF1697 domain-containing protein [Candidatus Promineifilaceae bacterium]|jgi:uncharacterized protein (DUF1697 family)